MKKFMILSMCFVVLICGCVNQDAKSVTTTTSSSLIQTTSSTTLHAVSTTTTSTTTTTTQVASTTTTTPTTPTTTTTLGVSEEDRECNSYCKGLEYASGVCQKSRVECRNNQEFSPAVYVRICKGITNTCCCRFGVPAGQE